MPFRTHRAKGQRAPISESFAQPVTERRGVGRGLYEVRARRARVRPASYPGEPLAAPVRDRSVRLSLTDASSGGRLSTARSQDRPQEVELRRHVVDADGIEKRPSHTAEGAAAMRAAGTFERDPQRRNPDALAGSLLTPRARRMVSNPILRRLALAYYRRLLPGLYEVHLARTHHFDRLVSKELAQGAEQLVVLGAGLDTRAYRFASHIDAGRAFEVDRPTSSRFKKTQLTRAGVDTAHVRFVSVDFNSEDTVERLISSGLDPSLRTVVTWEGVVMYLSDRAVRRIFQFISSLAEGSSIIFDYVFRSFVEAPERYPSALRHLRYVRKVGEPYTFGLNYEACEAYLFACGLQLEDNLNAEGLETTYLGQRGAGSLTPWYAVAHARRVPHTEISCSRAY